MCGNWIFFKWRFSVTDGMPKSFRAYDLLFVPWTWLSLSVYRHSSSYPGEMSLLEEYQSVPLHNRWNSYHVHNNPTSAPLFFQEVDGYLHYLITKVKTFRNLLSRLLASLLTGFPGSEKFPNHRVEKYDVTKRARGHRLKFWAHIAKHVTKGGMMNVWVLENNLSLHIRSVIFCAIN